MLETRRNFEQKRYYGLGKEFGDVRDFRCESIHSSILFNEIMSFSFGWFFVSVGGHESMSVESIQVSDHLQTSHGN
jgi:hypothetical protein